MDTPLITSINLNKICRICLTESEEMHSIFSVLQNEDGEEEDLTYVYEILMNISSIKILTEDQMPTVLCTTCLELANTSYKFQQQCNRSQVILETYLTQVNSNKEDESSILCDVNEKKDLTKIDSVNLFDVSKDSEDEENFISIESGHIKSTDENNLVDVPENININEIKNERLQIQDRQTLSTTKVALENYVGLKTEIVSNIENKGFNKLPRKKLSCFIKTTDKGSKVYACNLCDKFYKFGSSLKVHMRTHTIERPYVCTLCGKDFKQYGSLTYHLRSHSGEQPYKCKLCGKKYKQSGSLTTHMRVHTGQRPFLCSVCGRGFRQAPDLGYHMRTHTKEKPYMCNICGKTMSMQCHLVQHMRTHTGERPFKCTECDKAFPSTTRLKRHAIIHTGLKPYKCEVCNRSFNRKSTLRVHAKIHTDDRPHVCSVCGKGFIQAHSLKTHVMTHFSSTTSTIKSQS